ncbi:hypothetical protein RC083_10705 [Pseudoalteromonas haloplanktis]|uniref:Uncharacterized protein n=1 Tax=Pseudoalteromonas haloplanktis TaxID=228 RepID=A0ABU1BC54_PSEHA|nr:hypothetical protein [Pseudoalteromonas haloplanktis]MDQ9092058.1 hypothetical protein [Pseudoalteromonas haloplanktis]
MKLLFKIALSVLTLLVVLYWSSFFILPAITIVNYSGATIAQAEIDLPNSHLDFGAISNGASNTLHYSLAQQQNGVYNYTFITAKSVANHGSCGYVTNNEINKRVVISVHKDNRVTCN